MDLRNGTSRLSSSAISRREGAQKAVTPSGVGREHCFKRAEPWSGGSMNMLFPDPTAALERAARLKAKSSRIINLTPNA